MSKPSKEEFILYVIEGLEQAVTDEIRYMDCEFEPEFTNEEYNEIEQYVRDALHSIKKVVL